jgi:hypothetical protein
MKLALPALYRFLGINTQGDIGPYTMYTAKDRGLVVYLRSPPRKPPSRRQISQRNKLKLVAFLWNTLSPATRSAWHQAARSAHLRVTGFNLYTYATLTANAAAVATVATQTRIALEPPKPIR